MLYAFVTTDYGPRTTDTVTTVDRFNTTVIVLLGLKVILKFQSLVI